MQFRAIEAASGLRDEHFMQVLAEHGEIPDVGQARRSRARASGAVSRSADANSTSSSRTLYLGARPDALFFLAEALLEYEQQFGEWRFKHVQLVERVIGPLTGGTGGTLGRGI